MRRNYLLVSHVLFMSQHKCGSLMQQEHLQGFGRHWWYPAECEIFFSIAREAGYHLVFVNPTIDHLGMYS
jgi:hypothetical protein